MMRAFAMRLAQLGVTTYVVGDVTIPAVGPGDLIILGSASGETDTTFLMAEKAKRVGARIGLVTSRPESRISRLSDFHLEIHAQAKTEVGSAAASSQPMATLFEQSMLIALDAVVLMVMKTKGISAADMLERHFNLE